MTNPIVGIGELLWDVYPDGRKVAGGAPFNFAFHCHQLGHPAAIVSRVGNDALGRELRERVRELGLTDEYIQTDPEHPTGTVQVTLDAHAVPTYSITRDVAWDHIKWDAWDNRLHELAERASAVSFGTLALCDKESSEAVQEVARGRRTLCVFDVNLRQDHYSQLLLEWGLARARWVKLSDQELTTLADLFGVSAPPEALPGRFHELQLGPGQLLIVTRGAEGAEILWPEHGVHVHEPGVPAEVVDTVGAGDSFTAAMVCLHLEGRPLSECARFAVHYAARVCEQPGGTPRIDRREIERAAFGGGT